ncbi:MAG: SIMPL domain-containing protein [Cytophagaceae bacterium]
MIRTILLSMCLVVSGLSMAQTASDEKKSIHVTGSAEMEIIPDEIYYTIVLQEYMNKDKQKVDIEKMEKELQASVSGAGIAKENLQIENVFGQQWVYKKRKQHDFLASKRYVIKLSDLSRIDGILDKIDAQGIDQAYVSRYSHSKIEQYRKDLKIQAIKNAKEKAKYLLEAIGEQLGEATYIQEINSGTPLVWDLNPTYQYASNSSSGLAYNSEAGFDAGILNFKTIELRFEINVTFKIK